MRTGTAVWWGLLLGSQLVALWEFLELVLAEHAPRWRTPGRLLAPPLALLIDHVGAGLTTPLAAYGVAWLAVWLQEPRPTRRAAGASVAVAAWALAARWAGDPLGHVTVGIGLGLGGWLLGMNLAVPETPRLWTRYLLAGLVWALLLNTALWLTDQDALTDVATTLGTMTVAASYWVYAHRRARQASLHRWRAEHDALTGLLTRHGAAEWIQRHGPTVGLTVALDLDNFKALNDTWGHAVGDAILREVGHRLQAEMRRTDAAVRLGGDEFVVWMPDITTTDAPSVVRRLHAALTQAPYPIPGGHVTLGVSIGWAVGPLSDGLAHQADEYLLQAKRHGKNRIVPLVSPEAAAAALAATVPSRSGIPACLMEAAQALWARWPDGALLTDTTGRIVAVNPALEQLTGRPAHTLVGQHPAVYSAGKTPRAVYAHLWSTITQGEPWQGVVKNRRPHGTTWWARETIVPVVLGDQIVGYWGHVQEEKAAPHTVPDPPWSLDDLTWAAVFQPIVCLSRSDLCGWEALIRPRLRGQPLSPAALFAVLADTPLERVADVLAIDTIVRALQQDGWPATRPVQLFVNLRAATIRDAARFALVRSRLAQIVPPEQLVIEVGETGVGPLQDWERWHTQYPDVQWAQDDLGTGEADLARLVRWRPAWIKIDRALVARLAADPATTALVAKIVAWAHDHGARVIGEGVETAAQAAALQAVGADAGQGFWWSPPRAHREDGPLDGSQKAWEPATAQGYAVGGDN